MKLNLCFTVLSFIFTTHASGGELQNMHLSEPDFKSYQHILDNCVSEKHLAGGGFESSFNYNKLITSPDLQKDLADQQKQLASFDLEILKEKNEKTAFWINVYNFLMISKIAKDGVKDGVLNIKSVKDLGSTFNAYKAFTDKDFVVAGKKRTLDEVEKEILLKKIKENRIHFAVNCSSVGCPPLRSKIYTSENVNEMLNENLKLALHTKRHLEVKGTTLRLSSIFKWYSNDFDESGDVKKFILAKLTEKDTEDKTLAEIIKKTTKIEYIDYNWLLNQSENF